MTALPVKMERQGYQGKTGSRVKRVRQGPLARGDLQGREVDQDPLVVEDITLRMHCQ